MSKNLAAKIKREFQRLNGFVIAIFLLLLIMLVAAFFVVYSIIFGNSFTDWLPAMAIGGLILLLGLVFAYAVVDRSSDRIQRTVSQMVEAELCHLRESR